MDTVNDYLTMDVFVHMKDIIGEDDKIIDNFFKMVKDRISMDTFEMVLKNWNAQDEVKQVDMASNYVGMYNISRFLILMDYLYVKHILNKIEGEI